MFGRKLFNFTKSLIPKISQTELIALKSGNTSNTSGFFNKNI